jgi:Questin oxidase-like
MQSKPTLTGTPTNALRSLLDRWQHLPPEYQGHLGNHLPMALHALHALGADEARLHDFAADYVKRYEGTPAAVPGHLLPRWQDHLGDFSRHADVLATFQQTIAEQGPQQTLQQALPHLWPGVTAAAFHGLIRTAHALQSAHDGELAHGLAYWASRWQAVPAAPAPAQMPFGNWSAALLAQIGTPRPAGRLISDRMQQARHLPAFLQLSGSLGLTSDSLRQLALLAAEQFANSGNFTVLHMVTGCRAARVLLAAAPNSAAMALQHLVPAFTAAFLASGITARPPEKDTKQPALDWTTIATQAVRSDDDHTAKIVHACVEEAAAYDAPVYLQAARTAVWSRT